MSEVSAAFLDNKRDMMLAPIGPSQNNFMRMDAQHISRPPSPRIDLSRAIIATDTLTDRQQQGVKMSAPGVSHLREGIQSVGSLFGEVLGQRSGPSQQAAFMKQQPIHTPRPFGL